MESKKERGPVLLCVMLFLAGFSCCAGATCFHQDLLGLEGYIAYLHNHWINLPPAFGAVGFELNLLLGVWLFYAVKNYITRKELEAIRAGRAGVEKKERQP